MTHAPQTRIRPFLLPYSYIRHGPTYGRPPAIEPHITDARGVLTVIMVDRLGVRPTLTWGCSISGRLQVGGIPPIFVYGCSAAYSS